MTRTQSETQLSKSIRDALESMGVWVERLQSGKIKLRHGWLHCCSPGTPDMLCLWPTVAFLEIKLPGRKLSQEQADWHRRARTAGLEVHRVESVEEAMEHAKRWLSERVEIPWWDHLGLGGQ